MRSALLVASALALAGCDIGPDYFRPKTPEPQAWNQVPGASEWPSLDWWQGFGAQPLDALMVEARKANFDLAAAEARVRQADAQTKIAGGALLPSVGASGGVSRSRNYNTTPKSGGPPAGVNLYSAGFTASYELDFWGRNADAVEIARATADARRFDQETTALTVQSDVANTYFTILSLRDRIKAAQGNVEIAQHGLDAIRARVSVGTAAGLDVAQQESVVAEQNASLPPLIQALKQNTIALAILAGRLPEDLRLDDEGLDSLRLPAVTSGLPSGLLARRPDVRSTEAQLIAANAGIRQAYAAVFPDVTLTAQGGLETVALSHMFDPHSILYSLASSVTQPIFQGGVLEGGKELEKARWDELAQNYQKAVVNAFADVESSLAAADQSAKQEEAERVNVDTARRAYEISQAQLFSGTVDITVVLNTQRTMFLDQDLLFQARLAHAQALVSLFRALGGGWQA